jgi:hypothetical protein
LQRPVGAAQDSFEARIGDGDDVGEIVGETEFDNARGLQLVVEGADVLRPVRLMTNSAPDVARCIASTICV